MTSSDMTSSSLTYIKQGHLGQIISLEFISPILLLVGSGPFLSLHDISEKRRLTQVQVFDEARVHGIKKKPTSSHMVEYTLWGGKCLRVLQIPATLTTIVDSSIISQEEMETLIREIRVYAPFENDFADWIHDIEWISLNDNSSRDICALLFYQHVVQLWDSKTKSCLARIRSEVHCNLYAGQFYGFSFEELLVAAGTAFGDVYLWKPSIRTAGGDCILQAHYRGHEGSIFKIRFSEDGQHISSVSDDRTIQIWKVLTPRTLSNMLTNTFIDSTESMITLLGHEGRVWDARFLPSHTSKANQTLVSISEDASCRIWNISGSNAICVACYEGHQSKNVWSFAVSPADSQDSLPSVLATGGGDGGVLLWDLADVNANRIDGENEYTVLDKEMKSTVKSVFLLSVNEALVGRDDGSFWIHSLQNSNRSGMTMIYQHDGLKRYHELAGLFTQAIADSSKNLGPVLVAGGMFGQLAMFSPTDDFKPIIWSNLIDGDRICKVYISQSALLQRKDTFFYHIFAITREGNPVSWYTVGIDLTTKSGKVLSTLTLEPLKHMCVSSMSLSEEAGIITIGSRRGALFVYDIRDSIERIMATLESTFACSTEENTVLSQESLLPVIVLRHLHGSDSVTDFFLQSPQLDAHSNLEVTLHSVGRDGQYCKTLITRAGKDSSLPTRSQKSLELCCKGWSIESSFKTRVTKGWLECIIPINGHTADVGKDRILVTGFFDARFFVHVVSDGTEVFSAWCGGGHRDWDFFLGDQSSHSTSLMDEFAFMFIRRGLTHVYTKRKLNTKGKERSAHFRDRCLIEGYHGLETRFVQYVPIPLRCFNSDGNDLLRHVIVSGGENKTLTFHSQNQRDSQLYPLCKVQKYRGSIRCSASTRSSLFPYRTLFFCGGSYQNLSCWYLEAKSSHDEENITSMQCIDIVQVPKFSRVIETRIMDVSVLPLDGYGKPSCFLLVFACSDSAVRLWIFNEEKAEFSFVGETMFHNKCVQKCSLVYMEPEHNSDDSQPKVHSSIILFTAATDGRLAVWDLSELITSYLSNLDMTLSFLFPSPSKIVTIHQSGVKAFHVKMSPNGPKSSVDIASGGDDTSVTWTNITLLSGRRGQVDVSVEQTRVELAHESSVTGIYILNETHLLSASIDQRLKLWKKRSTESSNEVCHVGTVYLDIADISDMDVIPSTPGQYRITVVGFGLETILIRLSD